MDGRSPPHEGVFDRWVWNDQPVASRPFLAVQSAFGKNDEPRFKDIGWLTLVEGKNNTVDPITGFHLSNRNHCAPIEPLNFLPLPANLSTGFEILFTEHAAGCTGESFNQVGCKVFFNKGPLSDPVDEHAASIR
jgi:hypothetical protein